ncbi:hypothetical protein [Streptomyces laculatispora]|uniref:hypothetical protein n=1 Tax=Streptomyces laculatispora TaxID=887464 RepID=UPI001A94314B|nr:hypothetical protein [Streptomyces laculatispora]MBO0918475.1 hypothetical protein [Streptomyces laculatispora]
MSAPEERGALTPRPSLYSYALRLHRAEPEGRFPGKGYELPDPSEPKRQGSRSWAKTRAALTDLLGPLLLAPDPVRAAERLQRQLSVLTQAVRPGHIQRVVGELVLEDQARARALARCLTRAGSTSEAVCVGLSLLARLGEPEDVPYLRILGQLRVLVGPAVRALDAIDRPAGALVWLGHHAMPPSGGGCSRCPGSRGPWRPRRRAGSRKPSGPPISLWPMGRWTPGWRLRIRDGDRTALSLLYAGEDGSSRHYLWHIPEDGTAPEERAAAALHRLATVDPRTYGS